MPNRPSPFRLTAIVLFSIILAITGSVLTASGVNANGGPIAAFESVRTLLGLSVPASTSAFFATKTSNQSGAWNVGSTWVGGVVPASGDTVVIANTHTVTLSADANIGAGTVTVQSGGILDLSAQQLTAATLTIDNGGEVQQAGSTTAPSGTITPAHTRQIAHIRTRERRLD